MKDRVDYRPVTLSQALTELVPGAIAVVNSNKTFNRKKKVLRERAFVVQDPQKIDETANRLFLERIRQTMRSK